MGLSIAVLLAAVVGLFARPETAEALVYSYSLKAGDTRTYAMSMRASFTPQGIPGVSETVKETVKGRMAMKVTDVRDDGSMTIELKLTDVAVQGENAATSVRDYQNQTVRMRVSKSGEVLSVEGSSFLGFDPTEFLGADGAKGSTVGSTNLLPVFPSKELAPGDTWTESDEIPFPIGKGNKMRFTTTGKHLGFVDTKYGRTARVNMKLASPLDLSFSFAEIFGAMGGAGTEPVPAEIQKARMVMDGAMKGDMTARVIPETGDLVAMVMVMKMNIAMKFQGLPPEAGAAVPASFRMVGDMVMKLDRIA